MELISKKVLIFLCVLLLGASVFEGFLLYKNHFSRRQYPNYLDFDPSHPLALDIRHFMPGAPFSEDFMKGWNDDSFFGGKFRKDSFFQESMSFSEPKREDKNDEVRLIFDVKGHEKGTFDVKISNGQLTVVGKDDQKAEEQSSKNMWPWSKKIEKPQIVGETHWSQTQSFPLPEGIEEKHYSVERGKDSLSIIFKKLNANAAAKPSASESL